MKVSGASLEPEVRSGEYLLVSGLRRRKPLARAGDLIVFEKEGYGLLVKRVEQVLEGGDAYFVLGIHPFSSDSRRFGPVSAAEVLGRVIWRLSPA